MNLPSLHIRIARALALVGEQGEPSNAQGLPLRNAPSPLKVLLPFIKARGERRRRRLRALADQPTPAAESLVLPADHHWHDAGMVLKAGEQVQLTASGRLFMSRALEVSIGAQGCLWYRIGDGEIARLPSAQAVITATADGPLRLQAALPGAFGSLDGEISTENPPWPVKGAVACQHLPDSKGRPAAQSGTQSRAQSEGPGLRRDDHAAGMAISVAIGSWRDISPLRGRCLAVL